MHVLMLCQADKTGEAERGMLELCAHANFEWNIALFENESGSARFESAGNPAEIVASRGFDVLRNGTVLRSMLRCTTKARGVVKRLAEMSRAADVVLMSGHSALALAAGGMAGAIARRPVVWYVQDVFDEREIGKWELRALRAVSKWLVSGVICNSHAAKKSFASLVGMKSSHIEVIHPGVATEAFDQAARYSRAEARSMFGLPDHAYLLGCFDRLAPRKGQHLILDALARDPDAHVVLVGEALPGTEQYAAELTLKIRKLGLTQRVHFMGRQADTAALMCAVDVVVNASTKPDAFDRHVVSGMLASLPIVASRLGGNPEIVQHMKSGILVRPEDPEGFLRSLQMLRNNPVFAERLGKEAMVRARTRFSPDSCLQTMTSLLRRYAVAGSARSEVMAKHSIVYDTKQALAMNAKTVE